MEIKWPDKLPWGAIVGIATVVIAITGVTALLLNSEPSNLPSALQPPPPLTATIRSYPYRHAAPPIWALDGVWREEWTQPLDSKLEGLEVPPETRETVERAMSDLIRRKIEFKTLVGVTNQIEFSSRWYSVTVENSGEVPLRAVFLRFPAADYWINEDQRLELVVLRVELGDFEQKSEKRYTFWGNSSKSSETDNIVLGHGEGTGAVIFE